MTNNDKITMTRRKAIQSAGITALAASVSTAQAAVGLGSDQPLVQICGKWQVRVGPGSTKIAKRRIQISKGIVLNVAPSTSLSIRAEKHDALPLYDPNGAPWARGAKPDKLVTYECTAAGLMDVSTFIMRSQPSDGTKFEKGKDYDIEPLWATFGRLPGGAIDAGKTVYVDYECGLNRVDSIYVDSKGSVSIVQGKPHNATPHPPDTPTGTTLLANIWVPGRLQQLTDDCLYPIIEPQFPSDSRTVNTSPAAARLLPKSWKLIQSGDPLHILAWGDSVTAGGQASDAEHTYQQVFVDRLKRRYPNCKPLLTTAAWGGRNTDSFLNEPPGTQYNFDHAVIEPKPDLIIMEFVNDAYMTPEIIEKKYSYLLKRFQEIGAEWIILTPHFVRPDWMGEKSQRIEQDPRPYTLGVRQFCARHNIAVADASLRWGHLLKEGIPYTTLLCNSINHPDDRGHEMFAKAILELF